VTTHLRFSQCTCVSLSLLTELPNMPAPPECKVSAPPVQPLAIALSFEPLKLSPKFLCVAACRSVEICQAALCVCNWFGRDMHTHVQDASMSLASCRKARGCAVCSVGHSPGAGLHGCIDRIISVRAARVRHLCDDSARPCRVPQTLRRKVLQVQSRQIAEHYVDGSCVLELRTGDLFFVFFFLI